MKPASTGRLAVVGLVGLLGAACYAVIVFPMRKAKEFRDIQDITREGINREDIQPGGMRIWSSPFSEREKQEPVFVQRARKES